MSSLLDSIYCPKAKVSNWQTFPEGAGIRWGGGDGKMGVIESVIVFGTRSGSVCATIFFCAAFAIIITFCLFVIQIATLLGWICLVSSTSHTLGFPSGVVETFQLFKTIDGPRVTLVPCSAWQCTQQ